MAMKATTTAALAAMVLVVACPGPAAAAPTDASDGPIAAPVAPATYAAVSAALSKVGAPYAAGAAGPGAFDCSGLTLWALARAGIAAPHSSYAQYAMGTAVPRSEIHRGDLVFFDSAGAGASHVGLATSATTAVSATNHGVMTHAIFDDPYWGGHYVGARRLR
ncbi:MAG: C40 family peptidase [Solirubrobacterales bacterium]